MFDAVTQSIRQWLVGLFAGAIHKTSRPEDRHAAILWLIKSRDILASDIGNAAKFTSLNAQISSRAAARAIATSVVAAVRNYRTSTLPWWPMKVALPATLAAIPAVGGHGAGIAAFGSAIGLPVLLLVFLGTAGITSVLEAVVTQPNSRIGIAAIVELILAAEAARRASAAFRDAMREAATAPRAQPVPDDEIALRAKLLVPPRSEKHANFRRLAQPRTENVLEALRKLSNLSSPNYEFEDSEVDRIFEALQEGLDEARGRFRRVLSNRARFRL